MLESVLTVWMLYVTPAFTYFWKYDLKDRQYLPLTAGALGRVPGTLMTLVENNFKAEPKISSGPNAPFRTDQILTLVYLHISVRSVPPPFPDCLIPSHPSSLLQAPLPAPSQVPREPVLTSFVAFIPLNCHYSPLSDSSHVYCIS